MGLFSKLFSKNNNVTVVDSQQPEVYNVQEIHEQIKVDPNYRAATTQPSIFLNGNYVGNVTVFSFLGVNWTVTTQDGIVSIQTTGGGGGGSFVVKKDGNVIVASTTNLNFTGTNITVAQDSVNLNQANISVTGGTGGLTNLPVSNATGSVNVLATSLKFFNTTVAADPNITGQANITPAGSGGLPVVSPTGTILVTTTATATNIDLPQSVATSATPSFAGLNILYNTPNVSLLKKVLNYFASDVSDVAVAYNSNITTAPLTANRTLTLPDANTVTVIPTALQPNQVVQYISDDGVIHYTAAGGGGNNADFSFNPNNGAAPLTVQFADLTQPIPTAWAWTIGGTNVVATDYTYTNGTTATSQNPRVIFNNAKTYIITLTPTKAGTSYTPFSNSITVDSVSSIQPIGSCSVYATNYTGYTTQIAPEPTHYVPTNGLSINFWGVSVVPFNITTSQFSENTGNGLIGGVPFIISQNQIFPGFEGNGNALIFPQEVTKNDTSVSFVFENDVIKFDCVFTTQLLKENVNIQLMIANNLIFPDPNFNPPIPGQNPIDYPISFFESNVGTDSFIWKEFPTVDAVTNASGVTTVTLTGGVAICKEQNSYPSPANMIREYLFLCVSDKVNPGNICTSMRGIQLSTDKTQCSYKMDMFMSRQGINNNGSPGALAVLQNNINLVSFANKLNFTGANAVITQDTTDPFKANIAIAGGSIQLLFGTTFPTSSQGNPGDFYLQYNTSATPFIFYQKNGNQWVSNSFFSDIAQNNSLQLAEKNTFADLLDGALFPDFNEVDALATVLNVATTVTRLSFVNLYMSIVTTGVSDSNVGVLQSNLSVGLVLQCDGNGSTIGTWQVIITSVTFVDTGTNSNTTTILGHLKPSDDYSLNQLKTVGTVLGNIWTYTGGAIFANCAVPDFVGYHLGYDPTAKRVTYLPPPIPVSNVQTFKTTADSTGAQLVVPFNSDNGGIGTPFGTMLNGVFTFTRAVYCEINVILDASADPDSWGTVNDDWANTKLNTFSGALKGSSTQKKQFQVGDTYKYRPNNPVTMYGLGSTKCYIEFEAKN